jgi:O-antigen/teichoic acid export membrane protein
VSGRPPPAAGAYGTRLRLPGLAALTALANSGRLRNITFSTADHLLLLALWAATTPVFILELGDDLFGIWVLINAVVGLGGVFSLGLGEATVRFVARHVAAGRRDLAARVVETTLTLYVAIGVLAGLAVAAAAAAIADGALAIPAEHLDEAVLGLRLAGLALLVTSVLKVYEATINGFERFDVTARIGMVTRSFIILANLAAVLAGYGLVTLMTLTVIGLAGQAIALQRLVVRRFLPEVTPWRGPCRTVVGDVLRFGAHSWVQITSGALSTIVDRFLVGALVSPAAAGVYAVCLQLAQQIHLLLVRALAFLMPAASASEGGRGLAAAYAQGTALTLAVVAAIAVPLYALAPQVLTVWIGADFAAEGTTTLRLLTVYFAIWGTGVAPFYLLNGAGLPGWNTAAGLLHGLGIVGLATLLLPTFGLDGIGWARLAALPTLFLLFAALRMRVLARTWRATILLAAGIALPLALAVGIAPVATALVAPRFLDLALGAPLLGVGGLVTVLPFVFWLRRCG